MCAAAASVRRTELSHLSLSERVRGDRKLSTEFLMLVLIAGRGQHYNKQVRIALALLVESFDGG